MKKWILVFLTATMIASLADSKELRAASPEVPAGKGGASNKKALIVYFSVPETADPQNMTNNENNSVVVINGKVLGNTQYVASVIHKKIGGELFRIEPKKPYPVDHKTLVDLARKEKNERARPELKTLVKNFDQYDTVFLGYPIWWDDFPRIIYTFIEKHNLSGKKVVLFCTHGGSRMAGTDKIFRNLKTGARIVENPFVVSRDDVEDSEKDILLWLKKLGY